MKKLAGKSEKIIYIFSVPVSVARAIGIKKNSLRRSSDLKVSIAFISNIEMKRASISDVTLVRSCIPVTSVITCKTLPLSLSFPLFAEA